jgi:hypothetical protein
MAVGHWAKFQNRNFRVFSSSPWNFWSIEHKHALYWNSGLWLDLGVGHRRRWPWNQYTKHSWCWDLSKELSRIPFWYQELRKVYFLRRGSWVLLGHGSEISETHTPTDLCSKFQLSRCYTGREIAQRQTDRRTNRRTNRRTDGWHNDFNRAHFF